MMVRKVGLVDADIYGPEYPAYVLALMSGPKVLDNKLQRWNGTV